MISKVAHNKEIGLKSRLDNLTYKQEYYNLNKII